MCNKWVRTSRYSLGERKHSGAGVAATGEIQEDPLRNPLPFCPSSVGRPPPEPTDSATEFFNIETCFYLTDEIVAAFKYSRNARSVLITEEKRIATSFGIRGRFDHHFGRTPRPSSDYHYLLSVMDEAGVVFASLSGAQWERSGSRGKKLGRSVTRAAC